MDAVGPRTAARDPPKHVFCAARASPRRTAADAQLKRTSPRLLDAAARRGPSLPKPTTTARLASRSTTRAVPPAKPLVPVTERRSHEDKSCLRGADPSKWDVVVPAATSAGREGRQFAVANVGNNGKIYLRPTVRPVSQRCPQPPFTFPVTPPSTGGLESLSRESGLERSGRERPTSPNEPTPDLGPDPWTSRWTPTPSASPLVADAQCLSGAGSSAPRPTRQRRAMSDSTVNDLGAAAVETDRDAFRVVISRPGDDKRPRTMEDSSSSAIPLLDVDIPSWRIGTPRFTLRGTPVIRASSYAPSEEPRLSCLSGPDRSSRAPSALSSVLRGRNLTPPVLHHAPAAATAPLDARALPSSPPFMPPSTFTPSPQVIEPAMFTDLTFKPACDDGSIVRYSPAGAVTAATPTRLVAEITSPCFLDYELISDFFLTFRAFLDPSDLLRMLVARLRWALMRSDEVGMIVRVRTFVAVRHWILNYFLDDFVFEHHLRATFCHLLNEFVDELSQDASCRKVQLKILAELKKCWRRVCAEYWDGPQFDDSLGPEAPIAPGGLAGSRDPDLEPGFWEREGIEPPRLGALPFMSNVSTQSASLYADARATAPIGDFVVLGNRPGTPDNAAGHGVGVDAGPGSPLSLASLEIVSCSFPAKASKALGSNVAQLTKLHPVPSVVPTTAGGGQVATTPKALVGKRVRPTQTHKRNNSISDSLREHGSDKSSSHDQDFAPTWPSGGSLVRGNLLPPGQPFVDYEPHGLHGGSNRQTTLFQPEGRVLAKDKAGAAGAMSGRGMKKLLGSVRRALRNRAHGAPSWQGNLAAIAPVGPPGTTTIRMPGTAVVPQDPRRQNVGRPPVRIDLLGAEVAEDFKKAIREEEAAAEAERLGSAVPPNSAPPFGGRTDYSAAHMDSSTFDSLPQNLKRRPLSDMGITAGSKSIVIVDDTLPCEMTPAQRGPAGPVGGPSADVSVDTFMPSHAGPTPPDTPPTASLRGETSWPSSYPLGQPAAGPLPADDALPPFVPGLATTTDKRGGHVSADLLRLTLPRARRMRRSPINGGTFRMRKEDRSAGFPQSLDSVIHDPDPQTSLRGWSPPPLPPPLPSPSCFDVEPEADAPAMDDGFDVPESAPLRVLRRRPGGDLRAAANVGDLDRVSLRRSLSVGSLATYTESAQSSYLFNTRPNSGGRPDSAVSHAREGRQEVLTLGRLADKPTTARLSLFDTHSSKPVMRPSFEKEAQILAQIPDDDDDGGIEAALLKLEGKYEKKRSVLPVELDHAGVDEAGIRGSNDCGGGDGDEAMRRRGKRENRHVHVLDEAVAAGAADGNRAPRQGSRHELSMGRKLATDVKSFLSEGSHESFYSIPLLERDLSDGRRSKTATWEWTDRSVLRGSDEEDSPVEREEDAEAAKGDNLERHLSFDLVEKTESIERVNSGGESAHSIVESPSFLDDNTDGTDLSSELSADVTFPQNRPSSQFFAGAIRTDDAHGGVASIQPFAMPLPNGEPSNEAGAQATAQNHHLLPTPELSPVPPPCQGSTYARRPAGSGEAPAGALKPGMGPFRNYSVHLPFILAFDSEILAQQFTLIEKDALNDIDWKDLVDMKWKDATTSDSRSWVDFLRHSDAQGVEVVIARFNIMVKWAVSEIVLTQQVEERARCIVKLIHIASHCRRYRNFATLVQLTIALSSNEVGRLGKTWALVPAHDVETLNGLERLVTPLRNFHAIRAEMEMGSDAGCIPFVGIYTHDLLFNAQRPSQVASSPTTTPLINFERCRIGAAVVKTLLRLLEASTRYAFLPVEGITERCLWIGALSDEETRCRSESLEPPAGGVSRGT